MWAITFWLQTVGTECDLVFWVNWWPMSGRAKSGAPDLHAMEASHLPTWKLAQTDARDKEGTTESLGVSPGQNGCHSRTSINLIEST